jgi:hypothetical protein
MHETPFVVSALAARLGFGLRGVARAAVLWAAVFAAAVLASLAGLVALACFVPPHAGIAPGLHLDGGMST